jgi:hypothetical protein
VVFDVSVFRTQFPEFTDTEKYPDDMIPSGSNLPRCRFSRPSGRTRGYMA